MPLPPQRNARRAQEAVGAVAARRDALRGRLVAVELRHRAGHVPQRVAHPRRIVVDEQQHGRHEGRQAPGQFAARATDTARGLGG